MPQGGSGTGSGFSSGEDFVAARVSIDIDNHGIQTLKELSNALNNYRTVVESAGRSSENFVKYLQQMQQAGQQVAATHQQMAQSLQASGDAQNRTMGTGGNPAAELPLSRSAPTAYVDPFSGTGAGMGRQSGATPGSVQEQIQQQYIDPTRQLDPYRYAQAQAGRSRTLGAGQMPTTPTGAPDWGEYSSRVDARDRATGQQARTTPAGPGPGGSAPVPGSPGGLGSDIGNFSGPSSSAGQGFGGLASNIANEMAPGGTPMGTLGAVARGIGGIGAWAAGRASREPSGAPPGPPDVKSGEEQNSGGLGHAAGSGLGSMIGKAGAGVADTLGIGGLMPILAKMGPVAGVLGGLLGTVGMVQKGGAMYQGYKDIGLIQGGGAAEGFGDEMRMRWGALDPRVSTSQSRQIMMAGLSEGYHGQDFSTATKAFKDNLVDFNLAVGDSVKLLRTSILGGSTMQEAADQTHQIMQTVKNLSKNGVMSNPDMQQSIEQLTAGFEGEGMTTDSAMHEAAVGTQMWNTPQTRAIAGDFGGTAAAFQSSPGSNAALEALSGDVVPGLMPQALAFYNSRHGKSMDEDVNKALKKLVGMFRRQLADKNSVAYANAIAMIQSRLQQMAPGNPLSKDMNKIADMVDSYMGPTDYMAQAEGDVSDAGGGDVPQSTAEGNFPAPGSNRSASIASLYGGSQANASGEMIFSRPQELTPRSMGVMAPTAAATAGSVQHNVNFAPAQVHITVGRDGSATVSPNPVQLTPNQQATNAGIGSATANNPPPGDNYYRGWFPPGVGGGTS